MSQAKKPRRIAPIMLEGPVEVNPSFAARKTVVHGEQVKKRMNDFVAKYETLASSNQAEDTNFVLHRKYNALLHKLEQRVKRCRSGKKAAQTRKKKQSARR